MLLAVLCVDYFQPLITVTAAIIVVKRFGYRDDVITVYIPLATVAQANVEPCASSLVGDTLLELSGRLRRVVHRSSMDHEEEREDKENKRHDARHRDEQ